MPENIKEIHEGAFHNIKNFETLVISRQEVVFMPWSAFHGTNEELEIFVPDSWVEGYKTHPDWVEIAGHIRPLSEHEKN